jgi:hypothetical protein
LPASVITRAREPRQTWRDTGAGRDPDLRRRLHLTDPCGLDQAEFAWHDPENIDTGCYRAWDFQWKWYTCPDPFQVERRIEEATRPGTGRAVCGHDAVRPGGAGCSSRSCWWSGTRRWSSSLLLASSPSPQTTGRVKIPIRSVSWAPTRSVAPLSSEVFTINVADPTPRQVLELQRQMGSILWP